MMLKHYVLSYFEILMFHMMITSFIFYSTMLIVIDSTGFFKSLNRKKYYGSNSHKYVNHVNISCNNVDLLIFIILFFKCKRSKLF
jgi:hypothetical protein